MAKKKNENLLDMYRLMPADFRALDRDRTLVVVPISPIEYHGDHLPLGTDVVAADATFRYVGEAFTGKHPGWKFLFHPVIPLGADAVPHGGSLWVKPGVISDVAEQLARRLIKYGFRYIALFSGHGGFRQMIALENVSQTLMRKYRRKKVRVFVPTSYVLQKAWVREFVDRLGEKTGKPLDEEDLRQMLYEGHGGRFETSFMLKAAPGLMDKSYKTAKVHEPEANPVLDAVVGALAGLVPGKSKEEMEFGAKSLAVGMTWFFGGAKKGYMGNPDRASRKFGEAIVETVTEVLVEMLEEVLLKDKVPRDGRMLTTVLQLFTR